ncbi:cation:proton antiporter [Guyparkeria hydrothermalis]|uniref:cation:proton antiporter n=1 Tax=Guyparkeria hydrothermalis TaxID=923 RepID=UPI002020027C|nr:sodium:proton antiporter [Guyparkeria hydrothermalis]MCL7745110.1 cation:proton antiporter [Guyparkeria hydrothermalis]
MHDSILLSLTAIVVLGIAAQWLSWRVKVPPILFLLLIGIALGPIFGLLEPDALFGDLLFPIVSLAVGVILFEGSLTLRFRDIQGVSSTILRMVSLGAAISWGVAATAAHWFVGLEWPIAFLFGAIVVVTGPTVIAPLLRIVRPTARVTKILRWEGIIIDPIGALLAVLVFEFIVTQSQAGEVGMSGVILPFLELVLIGAFLGVVGGWLLGQVLSRHALPDYLINVTVLASVLAVFTTSNVLAEESGLLAVTVMGIWLANMRGVPLEDILHFKETLSILFISGLFILLAARIEPATLSQVGLGAALVLASIVFIAQPLKVWLSTIGSDLNWREKLMIAWIGPRGIVAAAVSGLFAIKLVDEGYESAVVIVPLTFSIIVGTVVLASLTARPLARALDIALPEDRGVLIVGANRVTREIAKVLKKHGFRAVIADGNYSEIRQARMDGLETYYGNPVSEAADRKLDLVGIGQMFAMSAQSEINNLAAVRYRHEFGQSNVFVLQTPQEVSGSDNQRITTQFNARNLFREGVSLGHLFRLMEAGAELFSTRLTESFGYSEYVVHYEGRGELLFGISPDGNLRPLSEEPSQRPGPGWVLIGLYEPTSETERPASRSGTNGGDAGAERLPG